MKKDKKIAEILADSVNELMEQKPDVDTIEKLAKRSGLGKGTVGRVKKAEVSATIDTVADLAKALDVTPERLLSQKGGAIVLEAKNYGQIIDGVVSIPQYKKIGGAMGRGVILRDQPGEIQAWDVTPEWVNKNIKNHTGLKNLCIVTGFGNSMQPLFNPGDPLIVDTGINTVDFDATYFFRVGDEGFIKLLQRIPGEGIRVISKNKDFEAWTIKPDMDFEVFGMVLKAWKGTDV